jgi:chloramphenicol 3-O phosphotransferase
MADVAIEDCERFVQSLIRVGSQTEFTQSRLVGESCDAARAASDFAPLWDAPNLRVMQTLINGARLDVRMQSDDGRAWLAVMWVEATPSAIALTDVTIYERPQAFRGSPSGRVVVLNGPSSVGKSSTIAAFADASPTPWAGFDEPMVGRLATKFLAFPTTAGPVTEGFLAALGSAARAGNQLIVSAGGIDQSRFREALVGVPTVYVGLDAPLDVLLQRQRMQPDKFGGLAEGSVAIHDGWVYDITIDTAASRPAEAARMLLEFLDSTS